MTYHKVNKNNTYTKENQHEYVTTKNCTNYSCPDDSACDLPYKGADHFVCVCTHYGEKLKIGAKCLRATVTGSPRETGGAGGAHLAHNSVPIHGIQVIGHTKPTIGQIHPKSITQNSTNSSSFSSSPQVDTSTAMNLFIGISVLCSLSLMLVAVCFYKRKSLSKLLRPSTTKASKVELGENITGLATSLLIPSNRLVNNPTYDTTCVDLSIQVFSPDEIKLLGQIGKGHFGKVFKGELNGGDVAVKVAKRDYTEEAMKEMETMSGFCHPNILRLIGIVKQPDSEAPWLLFEYMEHGDLANVLRSCSKQFPLTGPLHAEHGNTQSTLDEAQDLETQRPKLNLTNDSLFDIAFQIAQGMNYLSSQHFVHRDLAARNCLVSDSGVVKISDFGLSRDVYTCDYYKIGGSRLLPLRWMAPESIIYGRFTLESDVWAYGVLLWEIFSWGKQPYYGHTNDEVIQLILDGVLLSPPSDCHPIICQIMEGCWKTEPKDRLKFKQICQKFTCLDPSRAPKMRQRSEMETDFDGYEIPIRKNNRAIDKVDYMEVLHLCDEDSNG